MAVDKRKRSRLFISILGKAAAHAARLAVSHRAAAAAMPLAAGGRGLAAKFLAASSFPL
jgi:hypothetical protein